MAHDTIQILNCVVGYFNVKMKKKLAEKVDIKICGELKWECA